MPTPVVLLARRFHSLRNQVRTTGTVHFLSITETRLPLRTISLIIRPGASLRPTRKLSVDGRKLGTRNCPALHYYAIFLVVPLVAQLSMIVPTSFSTMRAFAKPLRPATFKLFLCLTSDRG